MGYINKARQQITDQKCMQCGRPLTTSDVFYNMIYCSVCTVARKLEKMFKANNKDNQK